MIDPGPDFRQQALKFHIDHLDGVLVTHAHCDHTAGLDDLRIYHFRNKAPLPCLVSKETADDLYKRFYFMFKEQPHEVDGSKRIALQVLPGERGKATFLGVPLSYFTYIQQGMKVMGFRFGSFAYVTDLKVYTNEIFEDLKNIDILVVSALRFTPSHMHLTVDEAVDFIKKVAPKKAYLTHLAHELECEKTNAYLPEGIELAYDGLEIEI